MDIHQIITIFCDFDDFCKELDKAFAQHSLPSAKAKRGPQCGLSSSEIMTILVIFQNSGFKNFKVFYEGKLHHDYLKSLFPKLPSYSRFIELIRRSTIYFIAFNILKSGEKTKIYYVDSTALPVCKIKRAKRHKVFKELAKFGKTSMGWFLGLKIHIIINDSGEIVAFKLSPGNTSDVKVVDTLSKKLIGLIFGDKGYIGKKVFEELLKRGLKLVTNIRKNMKKTDIPMSEKKLLKKRSKVETVIGHLKEKFMLWHTRHRSIINGITHLLSALTAYMLSPIKFYPKIEKSM